MPLHIVLVEPEIPQNTGNIARTCAATGAVLHLVEPLGFSLDEKHVRRAGLDYWDQVKIEVHTSLEAFLPLLKGKEFVLVSRKARQGYADLSFGPDTFLVFGKETMGLPEDLLEAYPSRCIRIPMLDSARSLNLSNAVAIVTYEALRQQGFKGLRISR